MTDIAHGTEASIVARLERLPVSAWHVKMRVILGTGLYLYTPEIYPTACTLGSSWATFWVRVAGAVGPVMIGAR